LATELLEVEIKGEGAEKRDCYGEEYDRDQNQTEDISGPRAPGP
jgi:hypothetical protein